MMFVRPVLLPREPRGDWPPVSLTLRTLGGGLSAWHEAGTALVQTDGGSGGSLPLVYLRCDHPVGVYAGLATKSQALGRRPYGLSAKCI